MSIITLSLHPSDPAAAKLLARTFVWRTHKGENINVNDMKLSHVFNSFRMIWQSRAPESIRLPGVKVWRFNRPQAYLRSAVVAFAVRLVRDQHQLTDEQLHQLEKMFSYISADVLMYLEGESYHENPHQA